jgi:hypothetical protein
VLKKARNWLSLKKESFEMSDTGTACEKAASKVKQVSVEVSHSLITGVRFSAWLAKKAGKPATSRLGKLFKDFKSETESNDAGK